MSPPRTASDLLDALGIDAVCEAVANGETMTGLSKFAGVSFGSLSAWIAGDTERSARVREAREFAARYWDEAATDGIQAAADPFALAKAKELAFHYRWRASKIAPRDYGDKVEHTGPNGGPLAFVLMGAAESPSDEQWQQSHK